MTGKPAGNVTGLILAGGRARRMGGQDKGLMQFHGVALAGRIIQQLRPQCQDIIVNANRNISEYEKLGYTVVADDLADFQGPLAGMLTGLNKITTPWMITAPCDGPFMAKDYAGKMLQAAQSNNHEIAVASCGGRLQPVYALVHVSLSKSLKTFLESNERKIDKWFAQHHFSEVDFSKNPEMFENINTPEQLLTLQSQDHST